MDRNVFGIAKDCNFPGVYAIVNIDTGKTYIGSSGNIESRLRNHRSGILSFGNCRKMTWDYTISQHSFIGFPVFIVADRKQIGRTENIFIRALYDYNKGKLYNQRITTDYVLRDKTEEMETNIKLLKKIMEAAPADRESIITGLHNVSFECKQLEIAPKKENLIEYCKKHSLIVNDLCLGFTEGKFK